MRWSEGDLRRIKNRDLRHKYIIYCINSGIFAQFSLVESQGEKRALNFKLY